MSLSDDLIYHKQNFICEIYDLRYICIYISVGCYAVFLGHNNEKHISYHIITLAGYILCIYSCLYFLSLPLASGCEVVALGTGNYNTKENASSGRVLHDSHAVVTARRSLMRLHYILKYQL